MMKKFAKKFWIVLLAVAGALCLLLAACGAKSVEINFEGADVEAVTAEVGEEVELPVPEKTDFEFEGWYLSADFSGESVEKYTVGEEDVTFYAKWSQLYSVKFELGGGTLSASVKLKEGANLYNAVSELVPTLKDHRFGEWLDAEGNPLSRSAVMGKADVTLTAHWKVAYTVEMNYQKLTQDGYEKGEDYVGYEYVTGTAFAADPSVEGFRRVSHEGEVASAVLSEDVAKNVFKLYFDRESYDVTFFPNFPVGHASVQGKTEKYLYGTEFPVPADTFSLDGHLLVGWTTDPNGEIEYDTDVVSALLYGGTGEANADKYTVKSGSGLYAVWSAGYTDLFGGNDYVYHFSDDAKEVYLQRGDLFFEGVYTTSSKAFYFLDDTDNVLLEGKLLEGGSFVYKDDGRVLTYTLYEIGQGFDPDGTKIFLDNFNGIEYDEIGEDGKTSRAKGTYTLNDATEIVASFTEADDDAVQSVKDMVGKSYTIQLGRVTVNNTSTPAFKLRNDEEYEWGTLIRYAISEGDYVYYPTAYTLTLSGYGTATYLTSNGTTSSYYYTREGDELKLFTGNDSDEITAYLMNESGQRGYMIVNDDLKHVYDAADGATLELDGLHTATYRPASGPEVTGLYSSNASVFGNVILLVADETSYRFLVKARTDTVVGENPEESEGPVTVYTFEVLDAAYEEFYFDDENSNSYRNAPLLVLTSATTATLYGYTSTRTYEKVAEGTYQVDATDKDCYLFTRTNSFAANVSTTPYDLSTIQSFIFRKGFTRVSSGYVRTMAWKSYTTNDNTVVTTSAKVYSDSKEGSTDTYTTVGGFAIYKHGETTVVGSYSSTSATANPSYTTLSVYDPEVRSSTSYYFRFDEASGKFTLLDGDTLGSAALMLESGASDSNVRLILDGAGKATYSVTTPAKGEERAKTETFAGTYAKVDGGAVGEQTVYTFAPDSGVTGVEGFRFIVINLSGGTFFAKETKTPTAGEYTTDGSRNSSLRLDGFAYRAYYTNDASETFEGYYAVEEGGPIRFYYLKEGGTPNDIVTYYFELLANSKFSMLVETYGSYLFIDNHAVRDDTFEFDGKSTVKVYTAEETDGEVVRTYVDENGRFDRNEDGTYTVTYTKGGKQITVIGAIGTTELSGLTYNAFFKVYEESSSSYLVESDRSLFFFDDHGNATKYNRYGVADHGDYVFIDEGLVYYVNDAATDAGIYRLSGGTATLVEFSATGYYTNDLRSLLFSQYGYVILGGETRGYYDKDKDGNVTIYRQLPEDENANDYGFVSEEFGTFESVKTWTIDGVEGTYYKHDGFQIDFKRAEGDDKYPVVQKAADGTETTRKLNQLSFTPGGGLEYEEGAIVQVGDSPVTTATVVRAKKELDVDTGSGETGDEEVEYETYLQLGNYRFDVELKYEVDAQGNPNATYTITGERTVVSLPSYNFLYYYYVYASMLGVRIRNSFGLIQVIDEYDETGHVLAENGRYVNAQFGVDSGIGETTGKLITLEKQPYTLDEDTNIYTVEFTGTDGYTYHFYFGVTSALYRLFGTYAYQMLAFTRTENVVIDETYTVEAERVVVSDATNIGEGTFYSLTLKEGETEKPYDSAYIYGGTIYYFARTREAAEEGKTGKVTGSTLYKIDLVEKKADPETDEDEPAEGEEETEEGPTVEVIPVFESGKVVKQELTVTYSDSDDGKTFVESYTDEDDATQFAYLSVNGTAYLVEKTEAATGAANTYTVTATNGRIFTVVFANGKVTVAEKTAS